MHVWVSMSKMLCEVFQFPRIYVPQGTEGVNRFALRDNLLRRSPFDQKKAFYEFQISRPQMRLVMLCWGIGYLMDKAL